MIWVLGFGFWGRRGGDGAGVWVYGFCRFEMGFG